MKRYEELRKQAGLLTAAKVVGAHIAPNAAIKALRHKKVSKISENYAANQVATGVRHSIKGRRARRGARHMIGGLLGPEPTATYEGTIAANDKARGKHKNKPLTHKELGLHANRAIRKKKGVKDSPYGRELRMKAAKMARDASNSNKRVSSKTAGKWVGRLAKVDPAERNTRAARVLRRAGMRLRSGKKSFTDTKFSTEKAGSKPRLFHDKVLPAAVVGAGMKVAPTVVGPNALRYAVSKTKVGDHLLKKEFKKGYRGERQSKAVGHAKDLLGSPIVGDTRAIGKGARRVEKKIGNKIKEHPVPFSIRKKSKNFLGKALGVAKSTKEVVKGKTEFRGLAGHKARQKLESIKKGERFGKLRSAVLKAREKRKSGGGGRFDALKARFSKKK